MAGCQQLAAWLATQSWFKGWTPMVVGDDVHRPVDWARVASAAVRAGLFTEERDVPVRCAVNRAVAIQVRTGRSVAGPAS